MSLRSHSDTLCWDATSTISNCVNQYVGSSAPNTPLRLRLSISTVQVPPSRSVSNFKLDATYEKRIHD
jgi:hypothetical protein